MFSLGLNIDDANKGCRDQFAQLGLGLRLNSTGFSAL